MKNTSKCRSRAGESTGVFFFSIRENFSIETTFFLNPPCKLAGMITLGEKIAGVIKLKKAQNGKNRDL
jgi:hypothetical protein